MKGLKLGLLAVLLAIFAACGEEQVNYDENNGDSMVRAPQDNTNESIRGDGTQGNRPDDMGMSNTVTYTETGDNDQSNKMRRAERKVQEKGQYNSNIVTPPPPNIRPGEERPEHTYGDTANRMDGANSVR